MKEASRCPSFFSRRYTTKGNVTDHFYGEGLGEENRKWGIAPLDV